jgi:hypothetical protein
MEVPGLSGDTLVGKLSQTTAHLMLWLEETGNVSDQTVKF